MIHGIATEEIEAAAKRLGLKPSAIVNRLTHGWGREQALTTPRMKTGQHFRAWKPKTQKQRG